MDWINCYVGSPFPSKPYIDDVIVLSVPQEFRCGLIIWKCRCSSFKTKSWLLEAVAMHVELEVVAVFRTFLRMYKIRETPKRDICHGSAHIQHT